MANEEADFDAINEQSSLIEAMIDDCTFADEKLAKEPSSQHLRRISIRADATFVESTSYLLTHRVIILARLLGIAHNPFEAVVASQFAAELKDDGTIREKPAFTSTKAKIRQFCRLYHEIGAVTQPMDFNAPEWSDLNTLIKIRNRLMHPKERSDLDVSNDEVVRSASAVRWFTRECTRFIRESSQFLRASRSRINRR